jgi:hypothetical protein
MKCTEDLRCLRDWQTLAQDCVLKFKKCVHCITIITMACLLLSSCCDANRNTYRSRVQTLPDFHSSCIPEGPVRVGIECVCDQICWYIQGCLIQISTQTHWNQTNRNLTAPYLALSQSLRRIVLPECDHTVRFPMLGDKT